MAVDNACYHYGVGERLKAKFEEGRVELDEAEMESLALTKPIHISLIFTFIIGVVYFVETIELGHSFAFVFIMYAIGGLIEVFGPHGPEAQVALAAARTCGFALCGLITFFVLLALAGSTIGPEDSTTK